MRRTTFTKTKILDVTRNVVHGFYEHNIEPYLDYLSDDFVWIGAFDFQFAKNRQEFLQIIQSELNAIPFQMEDESYELLSRDRDTFILCAKFGLTSHLEDGTSLQMHTRLTIVWKYIDESLKLIHVHGSNAQDIPLTVVHATKKKKQANTDQFIDYIRTSTLQTPAQKRMFRQPSGEHCIIPEQDILYLQANGQHTLIYTKDRCITVSGILQIHQKSLSDVFFRIHKSYLINKNFLTSFRRYQATLCNEIELPIGKDRYLDLKGLCQ